MYLDPQVVKEALLQQVEEGSPELWSPAMKSAWGDAYDALATIFKNEMHAQAAAATKAEA
jgi:hemoglobin-like flavoprotein